MMADNKCLCYFTFVTNTVAGVSSKSKRKISDENRLFQDNWEAEYFVVLNKNGSATCLIGRESVILKKYNIMRHYTTKHKMFSDSYPVGSALRKRKVALFQKVIAATAEYYGNLNVTRYSGDKSVLRNLLLTRKTYETVN